MGKSKWVIFASVFCIVIGLFLVGLDFWGNSHASRAIVYPTKVSEPIVPTRTRTLEAPTVIPSITSITFTPTPILPTRTPQPIDSTLYQGRTRWGVGVALGPITRYNVAPLRLGWYLDWKTLLDPFQSANTDYAQVVRLKTGTLDPDADTLTKIARRNPGSLWLIGNEPDVKWQDNVEPTAYARLYHQAYQAIRLGDPTAQMAIGGVAQPSPLRLRYLEQVLESYRQQFHAEMPIDVWNIHNFILREERGSWGVDIPPGITDNQGLLYEVDDSGNLEAFKKQIVDFRRWMAERGYRHYPLIVSEYGIPMPEDYGFPQERVTDFLYNTFKFFLTAQDSFLGYPADDNRLVQRWCWYSLDDTNYATGRLFDLATRQITATGTAWADYASQH
ncbi:MAG: hypothetical protein HZB51_23360 [Chloroflexi bacterium]|nr:hypothetical protein [Chloroflexota bacterium]